MADIQKAVEVVLRQEDSTLDGTITNFAADHGGLTRFGLTARYNPELIPLGFFDASMPATQAITVATDAYAKKYGSALCIRQIESQGVATALLSFAVNQGNLPAVRMLQQAVLAVEGNIILCDGGMGPKTVAAVNEVDSARLAENWREIEEIYYQKIVANDSSQAIFLKGWLNRVAQNIALVDAG